MSSTPIGRIESESRGGSATIGRAVKIVGQINSKEELYVDGDLEGTLEAPEHKLTVGPNGTVHASVKAREVVVLRTVQGTWKLPTKSRSVRMPNWWGISGSSHHHRRRGVSEGRR